MLAALPRNRGPLPLRRTQTPASRAGSTPDVHTGGKSFGNVLAFGAPGTCWGEPSESIVEKGFEGGRHPHPGQRCELAYQRRALAWQSFDAFTPTSTRSPDAKPRIRSSAKHPKEPRGGEEPSALGGRGQSASVLVVPHHRRRQGGGEEGGTPDRIPGARRGALQRVSRLGGFESLPSNPLGSRRPSPESRRESPQGSRLTEQPPPWVDSIANVGRLGATPSPTPTGWDPGGILDATRTPQRPPECSSRG